MTSATPATRAGITPINTLLGIRRASAGRIHAYAAERIWSSPYDDPRLGARLDQLRQRGRVDGADVRRGSFHRGAQRWIERSQRIAPRIARNLERLEPDLVVLSRERDQRRVSLATNDVDDRLARRSHHVVRPEERDPAAAHGPHRSALVSGPRNRMRTAVMA